MGATVEDIDTSTLAEAQRVLGTHTSQDTVNEALREVVRRRLVDAFVDLMAEREPDELERLRVEAWR
jgi:Arc/MetJ family transcription regulator